MSQSVLLQCSGLHTFKNILSEVPPGALIEALNVIIDRDGVISPRRGLFQYGDDFPNTDDRTKQLFTYKDRLIRQYYDNTDFKYYLQYETNTSTGTFATFDGEYDPISNANLRIKNVESNGNKYFTTNDGIKKISASNSSDFTTSAGFITDAGGIKALDVNATPNYTQSGFLTASKKCSYRIVWGITDNNENLILGSPSQSFTVENLDSTNSCVVDLEFPIPDDIGSSTDYFYQVYRTGIVDISNDVGDEHYLVVEDFPTSTELSNKVVSLTDVTPESFREGGALLYTNEISGEGILQANDPPPFAYDIAEYKNYVFYANTISRYNKQINLLSIDSMLDYTITAIANVGGSPSTTIQITTSAAHGLSNGDSVVLAGIGDSTLDDQEFTIANVAPTTFEVTVPSGTYSYSYGRVYASSFTISDGTTTNTYYFVGEKETYTVDFSGYGGTIPGDLDNAGVGKYFLLASSSDERKYIVYFDTSGTDTAPSISGYLPIKVDISSGVTTTAELASATKTAIDAATDDFNITVGGTGSDELTVECANYGNVDTRISIQAATSTGLVNESTNEITITSHGFSDEDYITYTASATDIGGLTTGNQYYIIYVDDNTFQLESTIGGGAINLTSDGAGTHTFARENIGDGFSITQDDKGDGEDSTEGHILLPKVPGTGENGPSISQQVDRAARSLVRIINRNSSEIVNAFYLSGYADVPGEMRFEQKSASGNQFYFTASDTTTGAEFNPSLPVSETTISADNEIKPNRIFYSKFQQPEAVPLVNYIDVGPKDKKIQRILALRDSLFIFKEDGIYRLSGISDPFNVTLFDSSAILQAPDSAVVLNNQIYCLSTQGVIKVSDIGVSVISRSIENRFTQITRTGYSYASTSFGVAYETDRAYLLWTVSESTDTTATQCYRYNTFTNTWTRWDKAAVCGIVNDRDDKLYIGAQDENFIEKERKNLDRTDHADRQYDRTFVSGGDTTYTISLATNIAVNDAIVQTQYLTISQYNRLLSQLDNDITVGDSDYVSTLQMSSGSNLRNAVIDLANKLDSDSGTVSSYSGLVTPSTDFSTIQGEFNNIVTTLNADTGVFYNNYSQSSGTVEYEAVIQTVSGTTITIDINQPFLLGAIVVYKSIETQTSWAPQIFGDPSTYKQVSEGTLLFEDINFSNSIVSYSSDMSPSYETISFIGARSGNFGFFNWSNQNWGGVSAAIPIRTLIPRQKQRCRYMNVRFKHQVAREKYAIFGISLTFRPYSTRAYR